MDIFRVKTVYNNKSVFTIKLWCMCLKDNVFFLVFYFAWFFCFFHSLPFFHSLSFFPIPLFPADVRLPSYQFLLVSVRQ